MPKMWGQDVVREIRKWESKHRSYIKNKNVKILMVTIMDREEDILSAVKVGCSGYVIKPVTPEKLERALINMGFSIR